MDDRRITWIARLAVVSVLLTTFGLGFVLGHRDRDLAATELEGTGSGLGAIRDAYEKIMSTTSDPPSEDDLSRAAIRAMIKLVQRSDPYALFYTEQGYQQFSELTTGRFSGIGVWLKDRSGKLEIVSVLPRSPALAAGLKRGDVITSIDGRPVRRAILDEVVGMIKGPQGTDVTLGIARGDEDLEFTITRAELELPNLQARMTGDDLGYIRLVGFARGAGDQVRSKVRDLVEKGAQGIVLDLRDNGGGLFSEAIEVASVFIESGEIVTYNERDEEPLVYEAEGDAFEEIPLVVLVNGGTASASEIVAGALQDQERAVLVGVTTYGKGSVQEVFPLIDSSAVKLTIGGYVTPDGRRIDGSGIAPDVEVADPEASASAEARLQKRRAIEVLEGLVLSSLGIRG